MKISISGMPRVPVPITPTLIRLLGAAAPNTEEGARQGAQNVADAAAVVLRKSRRVVRRLNPVGRLFMAMILSRK
jgi:hypothetical protein